MIFVGTDFKSYLPLYAFDLTSYRREDDGYTGYVDAVWFRAVRGVTKASAGYVRGHTRWPERFPDDVRLFLALHTDNRYGGHCLGRWDGTTYWGQPPQTPGNADRYLALLRPMLAGYPAVPDGYDGWWGFPVTLPLRK